jgi:hypothetical protein
MVNVGALDLMLGRTITVDALNPSEIPREKSV